MKNILLFLFLFTAFQTKAQFKYEELNGTQKQQITAIETAYNNALNGQKASISYNEFMLEISLNSETRKLPLADIQNISVAKNNEGYFLKLHHVGGWDYSGLYKIADPQKAETVKSRLQTFLNDFKPYNEETLAYLCSDVRSLRDANEDDNFYIFEYKMLRLAGITDMDNATDEELKNKMSFLWKRHYKDLVCNSATVLYPKGSYLRQLVRSDSEDALELLLDNYGFDPNTSYKDGCTVLDYVNAQIKSTNDYAEIIIQQFKKYREILLKYGAKTANEICGCTSC